MRRCIASNRSTVHKTTTDPADNGSTQHAAVGVPQETAGVVRHCSVEEGLELVGRDSQLAPKI